MVRTYIAGGFLWEDVEAGKSSKAYWTLGLFAGLKSNLSVDQRNLNDYQRLSDLYTAVKPYIVEPKISGKDEKRLLKARAIEQSIVLQ